MATPSRNSALAQVALIDAIIKGNLGAIDNAVQAGADVNQVSILKDGKAVPAILWAIRNREEDSVASLLSHGATVSLDTLHQAIICDMLPLSGRTVRAVASDYIKQSLLAGTPLPAIQDELEEALEDARSPGTIQALLSVLPGPLRISPNRLARTLFSACEDDFVENPAECLRLVAALPGFDIEDKTWSPSSSTPFADVQSRFIRATLVKNEGHARLLREVMEELLALGANPNAPCWAPEQLTGMACEVPAWWLSTTNPKDGGMVASDDDFMGEPGSPQLAVGAPAITGTLGMIARHFGGRLEMEDEEGQTWWQFWMASRKSPLSDAQTKVSPAFSLRSLASLGVDMDAPTSSGFTPLLSAIAETTHGFSRTQETRFRWALLLTEAGADWSRPVPEHLDAKFRSRLQKRNAPIPTDRPLDVADLLGLHDEEWVAKLMANRPELPSIIERQRLERLVHAPSSPHQRARL